MDIRQLAALVAAAALLAACSDGATEPRADSLTPEEVESLGVQLDATGTVGPDGGVSFRSGAIPAITFRDGSAEFSSTVNCPSGGTLTVKGTAKGEVNREARTLRFQTEITTTPTACATPVRGGSGVTLTVNGAPSLTAVSTHEVSASGTRSQTRETGGFTWTRSSGESGSCQVDLTTAFDATARTVTRKGTYCGQTIDETRTLPARERPGQ